MKKKKNADLFADRLMLIVLIQKILKMYSLFCVKIITMKKKL